MRRILTRAAVALIGLSALTASVVTTASPAAAWTWSSTVTLTGSECLGGGLETATVSAVLNGERHTYYADLGQDPTYRITFNDVPFGGGWAWFWVDCGVKADYGKWVWVYRPVWGSTLGGVNL